MIALSNDSESVSRANRNATKRMMAILSTDRVVRGGAWESWTNSPVTVPVRAITIRNRLRNAHRASKKKKNLGLRGVERSCGNRGGKKKPHLQTTSAGRRCDARDARARGHTGFYHADVIIAQHEGVGEEGVRVSGHPPRDTSPLTLLRPGRTWRSGRCGVRRISRRYAHAIGNALTCCETQTAWWWLRWWRLPRWYGRNGIGAEYASQWRVFGSPHRHRTRLIAFRVAPARRASASGRRRVALSATGRGDAVV